MFVLTIEMMQSILIHKGLLGITAESTTFVNIYIFHTYKERQNWLVE